MPLNTMYIKSFVVAWFPMQFTPFKLAVTKKKNGIKKTKKRKKKKWKTLMLSFAYKI